MPYQEAAPVSLATLEDLGWRTREYLGCCERAWLPVAYIIEHALPIMFGDEFSLEVRTPEEMGMQHGLTDPDGRLMILREDVYTGMVTGVGRDRMTAMHELAHLILHTRQGLARRMALEPPPAYRDPEWQAKCLAGTIMLPRAMLQNQVEAPATIAQRFGVSLDAAEYRLRQIRRASKRD